MRSTFGRPEWVALLALILVGVSHAAPAQAIVCKDVTLVSAEGVIGPEHRYKFRARCESIIHKSEHKFLSSTTSGFIVTMNVVGKGIWNRKTGEAIERLNITGEGSGDLGEPGSFSGERHAKGNCNEDPFLKDPPGGSAICDGLTVQYNGQSGPIYESFVEPKSILLERQFSLVEAQALSSQAAASVPPPPPPPPPAPSKPAISLGQRPKSGAAMAPGQAIYQKPDLVVTSASAVVESSCNPGLPAVKVRVAVKNAGAGTFPALPGKHVIHVKAGKGLASQGIEIPALGPGNVYPPPSGMSPPGVPIKAIVPLSQLAGTSHALEIQLNSLRWAEESNHANNTKTVKVSFPAGYCQPKLTPLLPATGTPKPGETRGLNPQPEPPSRTPLKLPGR